MATVNVNNRMDKSSFPTDWKRVKDFHKGAEGLATLWCHRSTPSRCIVAKVVEQKRSSRGLGPSPPGGGRHGRHDRSKVNVGKMGRGGSELAREAAILRKLPRHKAIIELIGVLENQPHLDRCTLLLEYCDGGDLWEYRHRHYLRSTHVPEGFIWHVYSQLAEALAFLHTGYGVSQGSTSRWQPIIHRDVKPENILLVNHKGEAGGFPLIKLADFGHAAPLRYPEEKNIVEHVGTRDYRPPEAPLMTEKADCWAMGGVIHFLATGDYPMMRHRICEPLRRPLLSRIMSRSSPDYRLEGFPPGGYSVSLNYWMMRALEADPHKRITASQILKGMKEGLVKMACDADMIID